MCTCEKCGGEHDASYGSGRFCSTKCARGFSTSLDREGISRRVREKLQIKPFDSFNDAEFARIVSRVVSWRQLGRELGILSKGGNVQSYLRRRVIALNVDVNHFRKTRTTDEWLSYRPNENKGNLHKHLIKIGRKYECAWCGLGPVWNEKKLTIQVDHINGDRYDHRPDNLRFLCPNCHSQTSTFTWKNVKKYP